MPTNAKQIAKVEMVPHKTTKNTYQFMELGNNGSPISNPRDGLLGSIYLKQYLFDGKPPSKVRVTVETVE